jgi:hypothetical protein
MDVREVGWEDVNWTHLGQDRNQWRALVNTVEFDNLLLKKTLVNGIS